MKTVCTIKEAAAITGLSEYELRRGINQGIYPHIRAGRKMFVNIDLLEQTILDNMKATQEQVKKEAQPLWMR